MDILERLPSSPEETDGLLAALTQAYANNPYVLRRNFNKLPVDWQKEIKTRAQAGWPGWTRGITIKLTPRRVPSARLCCAREHRVDSLLLHLGIESRRLFLDKNEDEAQTEPAAL